MDVIATASIALAAVAAESEPAGFAHMARLAWVSPTGAIADQAPPESEPRPEPADEIAPFGAKGSWRWYLQSGYAFQLTATENQFVLAGGGVSYFIVDNLSLQCELNGMYFSQNGPDAFGLNFALLTRWHFLVEDRWTMYADVGIGILGTTARVPGPDAGEPRGGGYFGFTPQAGIGFSFEVAQDARLLVGTRWYHVSNARTQASNPPRDSLYIYAGLSFPL